MSAPSIDGYLSQLREQLAWRGEVDDIVDEYGDHLWSAFEAAQARGLSDADAAQEALDRVGPLDAVAHALQDGGADRYSLPSRGTRLAGIVAMIAGIGWSLVGLGWFGAYFRPGTWWGHFQAVLFPALPGLMILTVAGLAGVLFRVSRPLTARAGVALGIGGAGALVGVAEVGATPFWCGLLAVSTVLTASALRGRSTLRCPVGSRTLLALWWAPTIPAHVLLQLWSDLNVVVIEAGWSIGFVSLGLGLTVIGRVLWAERVADRPAPTPLAAA